MATYNKEEIKRNPLNRINALHVPELVEYARRDVRKAEAMPHGTNEQLKAKQQAEETARNTFNERMNKLNLYKEIFPELKL
jgi:hypothetical protein